MYHVVKLFGTIMGFIWRLKHIDRSICLCGYRSHSLTLYFSHLITVTVTATHPFLHFCRTLVSLLPCKDFFFLSFQVESFIGYFCFLSSLFSGRKLWVLRPIVWNFTLHLFVSLLPGLPTFSLNILTLIGNWNSGVASSVYFVITEISWALMIFFLLYTFIGI